MCAMEVVIVVIVMDKVKRCVQNAAAMAVVDIAAVRGKYSATNVTERVQFLILTTRDQVGLSVPNVVAQVISRARLAHPQLKNWADSLLGPRLKLVARESAKYVMALEG